MPPNNPEDRNPSLIQDPDPGLVMASTPRPRVLDAAQQVSRERMRKRVALSSFLGTTMEYYDFLLFGFAAALVFAPLFFSNLDPVMGQVAAFGLLAIGYLARFLGAVLAGHFGDRIGRKKVMLATLIIMGLSSGLIGLLPTTAQIGGFAVVLLLILRLIQGLAVGGEYAGAVLMTAEHAEKGKRGRATGAAAIGQPLGALLATAVFIPLSMLPTEVLLGWAWRVPFLVSFALLAVAIYVRSRVEETPDFLSKVRSADTPLPAMPLGELARTSTPQIGLGVLSSLGASFGQGVFGIFIVSYAISVGHATSSGLIAVTLGTLLGIPMTLVVTQLTDRIGSKLILLVGGLLIAVSAFPMFWVINNGTTPLMIVCVALWLAIAMQGPYAAMPHSFTSLFPTRLRYSGTAITFALVATLGAGIAPSVSTALIGAADGGTHLVAATIVVLGLVSALAASRLPRHAR